MNKQELMKYAEHGVRQRLSEMQREVNELARLFPQIVCHQDGSVPSLVPVTVKPNKVKPNGHATRAQRQPKAHYLQSLTEILKAHPGMDTNELAHALGVSPWTVTKHVRQIATSADGGHKKPRLWTLKPSRKGA